MSNYNPGINNKWVEKNDKEEYYFRFQSVLVPIIPTILIIIMAILFRIFSSKKNKNNPSIKKKDDKTENQNKNNKPQTNNKSKNDDNKRSLLGGNPRSHKTETKKVKIKKVVNNKFFRKVFTTINKYKGFSELDIDNILKEGLEEKNSKKDELYFMGDYNEIKKYITKGKKNEKDNILVHYLDNDKNIKEDLYNKNDLINENKIVYINYNSNEIKLLFPKNKYDTNISEDEILKEILNSWCINSIYKEFNINSDYKIGLSKDNTKDKFNLYLINNYITTKNKDTSEQKEILKNSVTQNNIKDNNNAQFNNASCITINTSASTNASINTNINNQSSIDKNEIIINTNNETKNNNNIIINENQNNLNNQNQNKNQVQNNDNNNSNQNNYNMNNVYIFPLIGLNNVGSTCFMNATLQCLLHVSELNLYFINEFRNDYNTLRAKNPSCETYGNISLAYFNLVQEVYTRNIQYSTNYYLNGSYAPSEFKETLGKYNSQFRFYEANDSKDLILYLLQTFHDELNYFGDQPFPVNLLRPYQENRAETFNYFMNTYNIQNFSIVSKLFYGTYENIIKCSNCNKMFYSYQKFEFISFSTYNYRKGIFNIYNGFQDNQAIQYLRGNNQYFCQYCQNLYDGETCCKIIQPPLKLIINIDYGKNKVNDVKSLIFDEMIDITPYVNFNFGKKLIYQISGVCTHLGSSGPTGHYIAYCRNKLTGMWYNFNDSFVRQCDKSEINRGSPYLLVYEQI